jgi:hypothetical protein
VAPPQILRNPRSLQPESLEDFLLQILLALVGVRLYSVVQVVGRRLD